jgi:hypothetical protein
VSAAAGDDGCLSGAKLDRGLRRILENDAHASGDHVQDLVAVGMAFGAVAEARGEVVDAEAVTVDARGRTVAVDEALDAPVAVDAEQEGAGAEVSEGAAHRPLPTGQRSCEQTPAVR